VKIFFRCIDTYICDGRLFDYTSRCRKSSKGANGLQKRKGAKQKDEDEVVWLDKPIPRSRSANRMTLILIEEVDLVFEGRSTR
jgi:hypothetical protein